MPRALTKRGWQRHMAALRSRGIAGDVSAITELGLNLLEGIQDRQRRSLVRRNPRAAVALLHEAATNGDAVAAGALGYAYDIGLGVTPSVKEAVRWYRRAVRGGNSTGASNLATIYRDAGNPRLAFKWWSRASEMGDGDDAVSIGYCYQYGIGTRRDAGKAKRQYRRAIAARDIAPYGREEAMYHLAIQYLDEGRPKMALPLLDRAAADDDYPEAVAVLKQIHAGSGYQPCRCRRFIRKELRGHAVCVVHKR